MAIGDDWSYNTTTMRVYHSNGTTIYTVNALYSWLMNEFDDIGQMDDKVPMSAQTPNAYTMINGWFIDGTSVQFLKEGAITTDGYDSAGTKIQTCSYTINGADFVAGDVDKDTNIGGYILAFDTANSKCWIRKETTIVNTTNVTVTGGTGDIDLSADSTCGEDLYSNLYTLGTVESSPAPQIYIYQNGLSLAEWSDYTNWDRGHIDVLIKVREAGSFISAGVVFVYARQAGDNFDHYDIDLSAGGRNAVPIATSDDGNNDTGDYFLLYSGATGTFTDGEIVKNPTTTATAEVVDSTTVSNNAGVIELRGIKGTFTDGQGFSGQTSAIAASANGLIGTCFLKYDNVGSKPVLNEMISGVNSAARRIIVGLDSHISSMVLTISGTASGAAKTEYVTPFNDNETISGGTGCYASANITTTGTGNHPETYSVAGFTDVTVSWVNGTATYTNGAANLPSIGERVQWSTTGNAIVMNRTTTLLTLGNVTAPNFNGKTWIGDLGTASAKHSGQFSQSLQPVHTTNYAFTQASEYPYDILVECGSIYNTGRTLDDVYEYLKFLTKEESMEPMYPLSSAVHSGLTGTPVSGEEYIQAFGGYSPVKASPFGTFAGGVLFGAQGVWVQGMHSDDAQNYQLRDSNYATRTPPNWITIKVESMETGDVVSVFRRSGSHASAVDKWMYYASGAFNTEGKTVFAVSTQVGSATFLAADTPPDGYLRLISGTSEYRYKYDSWVSSNMFLLSAGAALATNFSGGKGHSAYVPFIDWTATDSDEEESVIFTTNRNVITRVRKGGDIIPFEVAGQVTSAGLTVAAIRTDDTIAT